jgi:lipopolysaccharide export system protein LptA
LGFKIFSRILILLSILFCLAPAAMAETAPVRIEVRHADRIDYDGATGAIVLIGSVHVVRGPLSIRADRMEILLSEDEKRVRSATATGRVEILDGDRRARAQKAVFAENVSEITLTGEPRLWSGGNELEADRIVYGVNSRQMRAEGRVRGLFLPGNNVF